MKQLTTYARAAGYLSKIFNLLNEQYFENSLQKPVISIMATAGAYGHFVLREDACESANGYLCEINIGAATLNRPIENVVATLLHEMIHYHNFVNGVKDTSRGNTYHNRRFKEAAEARGLIVEHHPVYGWSITSPADDLLDFCLYNGLTDILLNRNDAYGIRVPIGGGASNGVPIRTTKPSSTRRYVCPKCNMIVRATRNVNIGCLDCDEQMVVSA